MITVVISSYKYGHLSAQAVDSVICQTRKPDRIIFADDGIGDCRHIPSLYPEVEFIEREKNLGTVENFKDLLSRVNTRYVLFLGADNFLRQDALEVLSKYDKDIITYDLAITGTEKQFSLKEEWCGYGVWQPYPAIHGSSMYNVELAKKVGGYERDVGSKHTQEDRVLFNKMKKEGAEVVYIQEPLMFYRRHRENFNKI